MYCSLVFCCCWYTQKYILCCCKLRDAMCKQLLPSQGAKYTLSASHFKLSTRHKTASLWAIVESCWNMIKRIMYTFKPHYTRTREVSHSAYIYRICCLYNINIPHLIAQKTTTKTTTRMTPEKHQSGENPHSHKFTYIYIICAHTHVCA